MIRFLASTLFAAGLLSAAAPVVAQVSGEALDLSITDPDDIAAVCGGDAGAGQPIFEQSCAGCHEIGPDAEHGRGPHLQAMFGRVIGAAEGWEFGAGLTRAGADGTVWEQDTLHPFIRDASTYGLEHPEIADEQTRRDLFTYLRIHTLPPPPAIGEVEVPAEVLAMEGDVAYGEWLSGECASCHRRGGGNDLPVIEGLPRDYFITVLYEYQARARSNEAMQLIAGNLGDEEIVALAAYFASLE